MAGVSWGVGVRGASGSLKVTVMVAFDGTPWLPALGSMERMDRVVAVCVEWDAADWAECGAPVPGEEAEWNRAHPTATAKTTTTTAPATITRRPGRTAPSPLDSGTSMASARSRCHDVVDLGVDCKGRPTPPGVGADPQVPGPPGPPHEPGVGLR